MKIVVLSNCALRESQGSGYVILGYARELRARGHEVHCVGPEHLEAWPGLRRARFWRLALGTAAFVLGSRAVREADLLEFYGGPSWLAVLLLRLRRTRAVLVHHSNGLEPRSSAELLAHRGTDTHDGSPRRWYQPRGHALVRLAFTQADALVLVSRLDFDHAVSQGWLPAERVRALETPLPTEFIGLPLDLARPATLGYCGAWIASKGVAVFAAAATVLLRRHPALKVLLAGVGSGFDTGAVFPADVAARVEVAPFIEGKLQLREWYGRVAVLMMPSYSESFGLVVTEAMACGCAVVASRTGFAAALQHEREALVVDGFDPAHYAAAAERLLADDGLRADIARAGHRRVQSLRWSDAGERLERFYRSLCEGAVPHVRPAGQR